MRETIRVLYYPDMLADDLTMKKSVLFFDEIHFMDRPSFTFEGGLGTIGTESPLRQFAPLFKRDGVPLYVHEVPGGPLDGDFLEQVSADVNDPVFLERFKSGLRSSFAFQLDIVQRGDYPDIDTNEILKAEAIVERFVSIDLSNVTQSHASPMALLTDASVRPYGFSNDLSTLKTFLFYAATCSAKMNFGLDKASKEGFVPLADASPYGSLLGTKYARALNRIDAAGHHIPVTDLSFAIFDRLVPEDVLRSMKMEEVIRYRRESEGPRGEFLEYLGTLQQKAGQMDVHANYGEVIDGFIKKEVIPAAKSFSNKLMAIGDSFKGTLAKGVVTASGTAGGVQVFGDISLTTILALTTLTSAYVCNALIDAYVAKRATTRDCVLSYLLSLD